MDPSQQPRPRPQQRSPYISDFVPAARPGSEGSPPQPRPAAPPLSPTPVQAQARPAAPAQAVPPAQPQTPTPAPTPSQPAMVRSNSFAHSDPPPVEPKPEPPKKGQGFRDILSIGGVLVSALLLAFCLITFVFQSYQVDGPSMQTTLENKDHLIVWKVPKTIANLTGQDYIPNRGDVIVFNEPGSAVGGQDKQLIKRVIALPGERVTVKNDVVTVYNSDFPNGFSPDKTLPYGEVITSTPGNVDVTLKDGEVFVCGDNRTNSLDSRVFGPIDADQIVGKLVLRVLPLNTVTKF